MNNVTLVGNLTGDPEVRYMPDGRPIAKFSVAVNRRITKNGEAEDRLDGFFPCVAWDKLAAHVVESLTKGTRVLVTGRLQQRSWEAEDGSKRSAIEVQVEEVGAALRFATAEITKADQ
jgi:single-strand DNA-binding protein